jgi:hypothetical protein
MTIFAAIGGVLTPENRLKLSKGEIQMNHLARKVYPEATDINGTLDKVIYKVRSMENRKSCINTL